MRDDIVSDARKWVGTMYKWGGDDESEGGVDCSGLIIDAYRDGSGGAFKFDGRPIASAFGKMGAAITLEQAQPGDILYYDNPGPTDHVALYTGNGHMIEAPTEGQRVRETSVRTPTSVRRVIPTGWSGNPLGDAVGDAVGDVAGALNPFDNWAAEGLKIGMYVMGAALAGALVVGGVMNSVKKG